VNCIELEELQRKSWEIKEVTAAAGKDATPRWMTAVSLVVYDGRNSSNYVWMNGVKLIAFLFGSETLPSQRRI
jgi:hypothetical protein